MISILTSSGTSYLITKPVGTADLSEPQAYVFRNSDGHIVAAPPNDRAELIETVIKLGLIAERSAHDLRSAKDFADAIALVARTQVQAIDLDQAFLENTYLAETSLPLALGVATGSIAGGMYSAMATAHTNAADQRVTTRAEFALTNIVIDGAQQLRINITNAQGIQSRIDVGATVSVEDIRTAWMGHVDASLSVPVLAALHKDLYRSLQLSGFYEMPPTRFDYMVESVFKLAEAGIDIGAGWALDTVTQDLQILLGRQLSGALDDFGTRVADALLVQNFDLAQFADEYLKAGAAFGKTSNAIFVASDLLDKAGPALTILGALFDLKSAANAFAREAVFEEFLLLLEAEVDSLVSELRPSFSLSDDSARAVYANTALSLPLFGTSGSDTIIGSETGEQIFADPDFGNGDDIVRASGGNDNIYTGRGSDTIFAGVGDDLIAPGTGFDTIETGKGRDTVVGTIAELNGDSITDLSVGDSIELNASGGVFEYAAPIIIGGTITFDLWVGDAFGSRPETVTITADIGDAGLIARDNFDSDGTTLVYDVVDPAEGYFLLGTALSGVYSQPTVDEVVLYDFASNPSYSASAVALYSGLVRTSDGRLITESYSVSTNQKVLVEIFPDPSGGTSVSSVPLRLAPEFIAQSGISGLNLNNFFGPTYNTSLAEVEGEIFIFTIISEPDGTNRTAYLGKIDLNSSLVTPVKFYGDDFNGSFGEFRILSIDHDPISGKILALAADYENYVSRILSISPVDGAVSDFSPDLTHSTIGDSISIAPDGTIYMASRTDMWSVDRETWAINPNVPYEFGSYGRIVASGLEVGSGFGDIYSAQSSADDYLLGTGDSNIFHGWLGSGLIANR